ncbi:sigma-70 family RNA polymerase sigma factor [Candidatus Poribacteria bacterium]|nr:sigma-70 family RNA polymerase sigma factor [Candidatus Poribacteria bacterium]MBT5535539.1 sigma-70 family RNA polymerase sigma factor [Candidatus Poribacteria bacterium]MBT5711655.1 sigma-70 family RNA polymerase sigma factor [Candidatus Poribacteria bacterium]MBT7101118.1 sigma-70 family RNA polymerase sigma factor [Candidatus Poribacteria bacterium]MBT7808534.1 sigma-70 family RNA polymerase sigma factor [Candidatus Poribacteria bacterium]
MARPNSFDDTVLSQLPRIRAIGRGLLPQAADVDDFVQDVIVRVYLKRGQLRDEGRLPQWIAAIASNAARTGRRPRPPLPAMAITLDVASGPTPVEHVESEERWSHVVHALNQLSDADRELLTAHYIDEKDRQETRRQFGYSYTGLTTRLHRARRRLRRQLRGVLGLAATATAGASRRAEGFAPAPVATGGSGAVVVHALVAGVIWLMLAHGPSAGEGPQRTAAVSLIGLESGERVGPPSVGSLASGETVAAAPLASLASDGPETEDPPTLADGSDRRGAGDAGYAHLGEGNYLAASSPLFDYVGEEGLTIEGWYYFEETPQLRERWVLLHKEGSYYMEYWGPDNPLNVGRSGHSPSLVYGTGRGLKHKGRGGIPPVHGWIHIGRQFFRSRQVVDGNGGPQDEYHWHESVVMSLGAITHDTVSALKLTQRDGGSDVATLSKLPRSNSHLVIGARLLGGRVDVKPRQNRTVGRIRGRIGEVRVSSATRYARKEFPSAGEEYRSGSVPGRFEVDEHTIALWHFDEGPGATEYADASGAGHTLYLMTADD